VNRNKAIAAKTAKARKRKRRTGMVSRFGFGFSEGKWSSLQDLGILQEGVLYGYCGRWPENALVQLLEWLGPSKEARSEGCRRLGSTACDLAG